MKLNDRSLGALVVFLVGALLSCGSAAWGDVAEDGVGRSAHAFLARGFDVNPYDRQVGEQVGLLTSSTPKGRAGAAEALGYLRAYSAAGVLVGALGDESALVRREAAMALAWCGGRDDAPALLRALDDRDWLVAQSAYAALTNMTGMDMPYDALAKREVRESQAEAWRDWWGGVKVGVVPGDVASLVGSLDDEERLRGVRALGALGGAGATESILKIIGEYPDRGYMRFEPLEKHLVQSCIRSLGRLGDLEGYDALAGLLDTTNWARYAADALGDFGGSAAADALIAAYPSFSRPVNNRTDRPERCPVDDRMIAENTLDRMLETPYAIALALSRLPLDDPGTAEALRSIVPSLMANFPSDWDTGVVYEIEPHQIITAYLLEKAGMREVALDAAFEAVANPSQLILEDLEDDSFALDGMSVEEIIGELSVRRMGDVPYAAAWISGLSRSDADVARLMGLLEHENGWVRIDAAKTLMFLNAQEAIEPLAKILSASHTEAEYGYAGALEQSEYNDPMPRWREAYIRALGRLGATGYTKLLASVLTDERNVVEIQYAAALALDELDSPEALAVLRDVETGHPFHSIRGLAREALWRRGMPARARPARTPGPPVPENSASAVINSTPEAIVFIKGDNEVRSDFNGQAGVDPWRQAYTVTNSGPTMRIGKNLYTLSPPTPDGKLTQLTHFMDGFVADCEVSWDGDRIIFARRLNGDDRHYGEVPYTPSALKGSDEPLLGGSDDPWWHLWEVNVDGSGLKQITFGPYHDVQPVYLPDGRIAFTSSRSGLRDEYHGYPSTALAVMNPDASDIHVIGFNLGAERDPAILEDGRIVFSRLDNFYSRLKTEVTLQAAYPDGSKNVVLYGPERRDYWAEVYAKNAAWTQREGHLGEPNSRNRVLRFSQPQPFGKGQVLCSTSAGLVIVGPGRNEERHIPHARKWAVTSPFPLDERTILCAATVKQFDIDGRIVTVGDKGFEELEKGPELFKAAINIDLGLYVMDSESGDMKLIYNDPDAADFEARPIMARKRPITLAENPWTRDDSFTAALLCNSALTSRDERVTRRGVFLRVIEGQPFVARHESQQSFPKNIDNTNRWKNHGGTFARVLGTIPLAADGSFYVEVPADRLLHLQVLDSDRRVVGNQSFWMYARPGETRSCVGCHEKTDSTELPTHFPATAKLAPTPLLPHGDEFSYRAKAWLKGWLPDEVEERTRTVHAVSLMGRY